MSAFRDQDGLQLLLRTAADTSDPRQQRYLCTSICCAVVLICLQIERLNCPLHGPLSGVSGQIKSSVNDWSSCLCRKAFQLLRELVRQCPQDIREAVMQGLFRTLVGAIRSDQADVREATLALLALLVQHPGVVTTAKQAGSMAHPHLYQHRLPRGF